MGTYARYCIPVAHAWAMNRVFNLILGDSGDNIAQRYSADGQEPATHLSGGAIVDAEWLATFQNLPSTLPTPEGGWPEGTSETLPTEADALAAVAAFDLFARTNANIGAAIDATNAAMLDAMNIVEIIPAD